ncbi:von Willebrand factor type A domain-containing protein [Thermodesulfobacteriota bacterium]
MEDKEIKRLLGNIEIPEPGKEAREKTVESAMTEFRARQRKKIKGFSWIGRLTGQKHKGGLSMTRPIRIAAGLAVCFTAVIITASILIPQFSSYRHRSERPAFEPGSAPMQATESGSAGQERPVTMAAPSEVEESRKITPVIETDSGSSGQMKLEEVTVADLSATPERDKIAQQRADREKGKVEYQLKVASPEFAEAERKVQELYKTAPERLERERQARVGPVGTLYGRGTTAETINIAKKADKIDRYAWQNQEYTGRDKFEEFTPNPVKLASEEPVSTFSIDVDTAAYSFVRRAINNGHLPQKDSVRVEEMINYFDYKYPLPEDKRKPFKPTVAVFPTPWNPDTKLLHIGIKGFDIKQEDKPRSNLVFLIDVSGSMNSHDKLPLLKNSLRMLVDTLDPDDTVAMVVYAGATGTVLEKTEIKDKGKILSAIDRLQAGGSTAGGAGIRLAYSLAETNMDPEALNRVILATDGDFNVGIRDPQVLQDFVERKRNQNIYLSVLGFGQGNYNDALMQKLAQNGNGNAAYIDTLNEARKVLVDEVKGTLFTIAKDVKIQVEFNPLKVAEYRLIGYETRMLKREDFNNDKVDAGDIGSGHSVTAIYEITPVGSNARLVDDLRYSSKTEPVVNNVKSKSSEYAFLKIRYKLPDDDTSKLISTGIDSEYEYSALSASPEESRFAAAVAAFGQLLRGDSYMGQYDYDDIIDLARGSRGEDFFGYRAEFLNLVRLSKTAAAMGER